MLVERSQDEIMTIFHRDEVLHLDDLMCHRTTSSSIEVVRVTNDDKILDCFASFVARFVMQNVNVNKITQVE